jgi:zinc protease
MALVLVGDVSAEGVVPVLERTLGTLPADPGTPLNELPPPPEIGGARRVQATLPGMPRLRMGWRLPPRGHADHLGLRVLASLLAGGPGSRLRWGPLEPRGILANLEVAFGVPGARDGGLLIFEAAPGEGHSLAEAEQAITAEILRVQQDPLQDEEIHGAQRRVMLEGLEAQEDAGTCAVALGEAWSQAGQWHLGLPDPSRVKTWGSEELRRLARTWLSLDRAVTVLAEPDPLTAEEDPLDGRLMDALRGMARKRMDDPAAVDALVRSSIRQLRMLPRAERERVLGLLRAEGRP